MRAGRPEQPEPVTIGEWQRVVPLAISRSHRHQVRPELTQPAAFLPDCFADPVSLGVCRYRDRRRFPSPVALTPTVQHALEEFRRLWCTENAQRRPLFRNTSGDILILMCDKVQWRLLKDLAAPITASRRNCRQTIVAKSSGSSAEYRDHCGARMKTDPYLQLADLGSARQRAWAREDVDRCAEMSASYPRKLRVDDLLHFGLKEFAALRRRVVHHIAVEGCAPQTRCMPDFMRQSGTVF